MNELLGSTLGAITGNFFDVQSEKRGEARWRRQQAMNKQSERDMARMYNDMALERFEKTGYGAQAQQLRDAGMNIGLMYGQAGAGGQASATTAGTRESTSPTYNNTGQYMAIGQQGALINAQIKATEAQANKTEAEAQAIGGYQKTESEARTENLLQGITNQKAQEALTKAQERMQSIQADIADQSMEDVIKKINYETFRALHEVKTAQYEADLSEATYNDKVEIVRQEAIYQAVRVILTKSQTNLTSAQIDKIANDIKISKGELGVKEYEAMLKANNITTGQATGKIIERLLRTAGEEESWKYQDKYK